MRGAILLLRIQTDSWSSGIASARICLHLVFLFNLVFSLPFFAQAVIPENFRNFRFQHLGIDDGLSQNFVPCIIRDKVGFMWMGTKDGLNMYDGYHFKVYKHNPFDPHSISGNFIKTVFCDSQGRLWIGTLNGGLNVYDRQSGRFYHFKHSAVDENSLSSDNIQAIMEDANGDIWVGTNVSGVNRLRIRDRSQFPVPANIEVDRMAMEFNGIKLNETSVLSLTTDKFNALWIGTESYILEVNISGDVPVFKQISCVLTSTNDYTDDYPTEPSDAGRIIFEDYDGELWMLNRHGLFRYSREYKAFIQFKFKDPGYNLFRTLAATAYLNQNEKEIWVCKEDRIVIINPQTAEVAEILHDPSNPESIQRGHLISLYADPGGTMWIGSNGFGLSMYDPYSTKFNYPRDIGTAGTGEPGITSRELSIRSFLETDRQKEELWLGTNEGLFRINRKTGVLRPVTILSSSILDEGLIVYAIAEDKEHTLWLGTSWGLIQFDPVTGESGIYHPMLQDSDADPDGRIARVFISGDKIWILTPYSIASFNPASGKFSHIRYNNNQVNRFREMVYPYLYEDSKGNFWVGTPDGLLYFETQIMNFTHQYQNNPEDHESLGYNDVRSIVPDPYDEGRFLWLATGGGGICRFDFTAGKFRTYTERDGLPNNMVYGMLQDGSGALWLSTNNGLCRFEINTESTTNYNVTDGLQSNEFNSGAFYASRDGELFFGGIKGYNCFIPNELPQKPYSPPIVFTGFTLMSQLESDVLPDPFRDFIRAGSVVLPYSHNFFSIEFSSLDYSISGKKKYAYSFSRGEDNWLELGTSRSIPFTDIKPGAYILKVRGTNSDGVWSTHEAVMRIKVKNPWWGTIWAYLIYLLIFLGIGAAIRRYELSRILLQNRVRMADLDNQKHKEVNQMKSEFFANISHEFRTPLTLIKGPLEDMLTGPPGRIDRKMLVIMNSNANKLLRLINQLLDLSRLENHKYEIVVARGNITGFLKGLFLSWSSLSVRQSVALQFATDHAAEDESIQKRFYFDRDVIQKIIDNLMSNAIKFTPEGGTITMDLSVRRELDASEWLAISVADTGIGIPEENLPYIFDRFYQVDPTSRRAHEGTGIGLAFVRELVNAHKGIVLVESQPGKGTVFTLRFPVGRAYYENDQIIEGQADSPLMLTSDDYPDTDQALSDSTTPEIRTTPEKTFVLVVEDNADVRNYVCDALRDEFEVIPADGAEEGLRLSETTIPDLIISDVMMPGIDGIEFCRRIKSSELTSHVPVILLTARSAEEDRIFGLETGADDYITKPFNRRELLIRVRNIIRSRRLLRDKFGKDAVLKPAELAVSTRDRVFMEKLLSIVEKNMDNEQFGVEILASAVAMSTTQLLRKLKALADISPNHFIRNVRMERAKLLLDQDAGNISEIAFMVGYSDPGYFSKTYRSYFGKLPSKVRKKPMPEE
jgi:signal transduction histidine kinase/ligand-binding sensor domain-containing protein/DNA-binding response OmpR family regulator